LSGPRETALRVAKRIRERIAAGDLRLGATSDETVAAFAANWVKALTGNLKASTVQFYDDNLRRHVLPLLGSRPVGSVTRSDCRDVVTTARNKGLKLNTVKGIARTLSALLSQAVEDERLDANPALRMGRYLRRGDEPKGEIHPLSAVEVDLLVLTAKEHFPRWHAWVLCALRTGLRSGELLGLSWSDVDWNGRFIVVQRNIVRGVLTSPKSHQRRRVDMSVQLTEVLLAWRRTQRAHWMKKGKDAPLWVFPSRDGTALEERNVRHVFTRILEKAELRQLRVHDLRHTFATQLLQAGAPITYVAKQLGHADASITLRVYAHYLPDPSRKDVDLLDTQPSATPAQPDDTIAADDASEVAELFGKSGEPDFHQLEPDRGVAEAARGSSAGGLTRPRSRTFGVASDSGRPLLSESSRFAQGPARSRPRRRLAPSCHQPEHSSPATYWPG
jgi:integrase